MTDYCIYVTIIFDILVTNQCYVSFRLGAFLFGLMVTIGQVIFAAGAYLDNRYVMYAGRFVFG